MAASALEAGFLSRCVLGSPGIIAHKQVDPEAGVAEVQGPGGPGGWRKDEPSGCRSRVIQVQI